LATHSQKLLDTYPFPRIKVADHKLMFESTPARATVGKVAAAPKPTPAREPIAKKEKTYFSDLSVNLEKEFAEIAGENPDGGNE